jgi:hypothetical protein
VDLSSVFKPHPNSDAEPMPRRGAIYRCNVCHLELVVESASDRLVLAAAGIGRRTAVTELTRSLQA